MKRKIRAIVPAAAVAALILSGCSGQSVTYDAGQTGTSSPAAAAAASSEAALPIVTSSQPAVTETPTPTATPIATPTAAPTLTPVATPTPETISPTLLTPTPDPDAGLKVLGTKAEGINIFKVRLKNATGMNVTYFGVKDNFTDYFPENMLKETGEIKNDERRLLYFDAAHALKESADREEKAAYEIRLGLKTDEEMKDAEDEGRFVILHDIPFQDFEEAEICFTEDGIAYLKYRSKITNKEMSTEEAEKKLAAAEEEEEEEEEERSSDEDRSDNSGNDNNDNSNNDNSNNNNDNGGQDEDQQYEAVDDGGDEDDDAAYDYVPIEEDGGDAEEEVIYYDEDTYDEVVG